MIKPISHAIAKTNLNSTMAKGLTKNLINETPKGLTKSPVRYDAVDSEESLGCLTTLEGIASTLMSIA